MSQRPPSVIFQIVGGVIAAALVRGLSKRLFRSVGGFVLTLVMTVLIVVLSAAPLVWLGRKIKPAASPLLLWVLASQLGPSLVGLASLLFYPFLNVDFVDQVIMAGLSLWAFFKPRPWKVVVIAALRTLGAVVGLLSWINASGPAATEIQVRLALYPFFLVALGALFFELRAAKAQGSVQSPGAAPSPSPTTPSGRLTPEEKLRRLREGAPGAAE